jgi:hypothetical protein
VRRVAVAGNVDDAADDADAIDVDQLVRVIRRPHSTTPLPNPHPPTTNNNNGCWQTTAALEDCAAQQRRAVRAVEQSRRNEAAAIDAERRADAAADAARARARAFAARVDADAAAIAANANAANAVDDDEDDDVLRRLGSALERVERLEANNRVLILEVSCYAIILCTRTQKHKLSLLFSIQYLIDYIIITSKKKTFVA